MTLPQYRLLGHYATDARSLHQGEINILLSIQALDLGDYGFKVAICHIKNSLAEPTRRFRY